MAETYRIEIRLEPGPSLSYWLPDGSSAYAVHVYRGDTIVWWCPNPFTIRFGDPTPMAEYRLYSMAASPTHERVVQVRSNAPPGRHKYTVSVNAGGGPPVLDDPEIIIEPEFA